MAEKRGAGAGCITQIGTGTDMPILHTVELLDWAYGGPTPARLSV